METSYSEIKKKNVINVLDGRDLGKVIDITFTYPDGNIKSIIVPGKKNAFFKTNELIINFCCIEKIGNDAILVRLHQNACEAKAAAKDEKRVVNQIDDEE